jgi:hypothetical protein
MLAGAWLATQWLLRESAISRDRNTAEVRGEQRDADDIWWSEDKPLSMLRTMLNPALAFSVTN